MLSQRSLRLSLFFKIKFYLFFLVFCLSAYCFLVLWIACLMFLLHLIWHWFLLVNSLFQTLYFSLLTGSFSLFLCSFECSLFFVWVLTEIIHLSSKALEHCWTIALNSASGILVLSISFFFSGFLWLFYLEHISSSSHFACLFVLVSVYQVDRLWLPNLSWWLYDAGVLLGSLA